MIVIIDNWKKKLLQVGAALVLIAVFIYTLPIITGLLHKQVPVDGRWFQEEHPSGNPMRVEDRSRESNFDRMMDQFVIKIQDFYYEE
jgi:hypothetical protein